MSSPPVAIGRMQKSQSRLRARADGHDTPFTVLDAVRIDGELTRLRALVGDTPDRDRLEVRADDGSRLTFTRDQAGRVLLAVGQVPDRSVSVRLAGGETARVRAWLGGVAAGPDSESEREALAWFRENPAWLDKGPGYGLRESQVHAATIVRAALARGEDDGAAHDIPQAEWVARAPLRRVMDGKRAHMADTGCECDSGELCHAHQLLNDLSTLIYRGEERVMVNPDTGVPLARDVPAPTDEPDRALGAEREVRSELAELRDHLSLPDDATAADVVARAKLVAEWPSCFDLIAEGSRWEIVHRAAPDQAGPPPPLCDSPCEGCGTADRAGTAPTDERELLLECRNVLRLLDLTGSGKDLLRRVDAALARDDAERALRGEELDGDAPDLPDHEAIGKVRREVARSVERSEFGAYIKTPVLLHLADLAERAVRAGDDERVETIATELGRLGTQARGLWLAEEGSTDGEALGRAIENMADAVLELGGPGDAEHVRGELGADVDGTHEPVSDRAGAPTDDPTGDLQQALARLRSRADGHDTPLTVLDATRIDAELTQLRALVGDETPEPDADQLAWAIDILHSKITSNERVGAEYIDWEMLPLMDARALLAAAQRVAPGAS